MKRLFSTLISIFIFLLVSSFFTPDVSAKVLSMEKGTVTIGKDEIIDDDLFVGAEDVEIDGTINGNVYAGAQTVRVNGTINGNLHAGASVVYLSGNISGNVYVGAGNVTVSGAKIGNSLHLGAGNINIDKDSSIGSSLIAAGGTVAIYGPVKRNVMVGGGSVDLNSEIGGEVRIGAGDITIGPNTKIAKDLYYVVDQNQSDIKMSESASVSGMVKRVENNITSNKDIESTRKEISKSFRALGIFAKIISFLGALVVGFLWIRFLPTSLTKSSELVRETFWKSLGVGFLVTIAAIPTLLLLTITLIGIPIAGILLLIMLLSIYLTKIVVGMSLGNWLIHKFGKKNMSVYVMYSIGLAFVYLIKSIPAFGILVSVIIFWEGLGALTLFYKSLVATK